MIQTPKSATTYAADILAALQQTGITQTAPGGKARAFADIVASEISTLEVGLFQNLAQTLLPYATGNNLDLLGQIFGIPRLPASDASVVSDDGNFEFFVNSGTFGAINNGQDIVVPAGTILYTAAGNNGPAYQTSSAVTLPASSSSVFFDADALQPGSGGNSAAGVFTQSNFTNYASASYGSLRVTNNFGITSGADQESDADYAYRINLHLSSRGGSTQNDLTALLLAIPGIQKVVFNPLAGTFEVYVYGISTQIAPSLLSQVQHVLDSNTAYPLVGTALAPALVGISASTSLTLVPGLSSSDITGVLTSANTAASNYINNLGVGATFVINQLADQILSSDTRIQSIGQPNKPFSQLLVWRSRSDGTRYSRSLIADLTPNIGERIITEYSISTPIGLTTS